MPEIFCQILTFDLWKLVHFFDSHAFIDKPDSILELNQLLVSHNVSVHILSK